LQELIVLSCFLNEKRVRVFFKSLRLLNIERNKYARDDNENHITFCVGVQSKVAEIRVRKEEQSHKHPLPVIC